MKRPFPRPKPNSAMPSFDKAHEIATRKLNLPKSAPGTRLRIGNKAFFKNPGGKIAWGKAD